MENKTYNGWTNRETWLVNLWFEPQNASDLESIKYQIEEDVESLPAYLKDFINTDIIDWDELASYFEEEEAVL